MYNFLQYFPKQYKIIPVNGIKIPNLYKTVKSQLGTGVSKYCTLYSDGTGNTQLFLAKNDKLAY